MTGVQTCALPILISFFLNRFILFIYLFIGCVGSSVAVRRLSLVAASGGYSWLWCTASHSCGFFCCGARALGARASVVVAHGLSCSVACGIFPDQGSNPCPLNWQADS